MLDKNKVSEDFWGLGTAIESLIIRVSLAFSLVLGIWKFREHKNNPTKVSVGSPIVYHNLPGGAGNNFTGGRLSR